MRLTCTIKPAPGAEIGIVFSRSDGMTARIAAVLINLDLLGESQLAGF